MLTIMCKLIEHLNTQICFFYLQGWAYNGYNTTNVVDFLKSQSDTLTSPNIALDLRIIDSFKYM